MSRISSRRRAGLLIPLFSCPSSASWGIGDIGDIEPMTAWLASAGQRVLQILPLNEMAAGSQSPYSALSAMAIDPIFIRVIDIPDFAALGGESSLDASDRVLLARARQAPRVDYAAVRHLKDRALARSFAKFVEEEWDRGTGRAAALRAFQSRESWWLDDYALFRALHERLEHVAWTSWPEPLQRRESNALSAARVHFGHEILFRQYLQWIADLQWREARTAAERRGVEIFGDLPFMVDSDSADVWAHQAEFRLDASVGVPPDAFSATGQDWGMPPYRWDVVAQNDFRWLRDRAKRSADLYDGYRVDHLVGFYRTYSRMRGGGAASFDPATEPEQLRLGEHTLSIFRGSRADIIAEDLGVIPDFVRASLNRLGVPGLRVFRWEREWTTDGHPFRDPVSYPQRSVACSGTHDTEPLVTWWEQAPEDEKRRVLDVPSLRDITARAHSLDNTQWAELLHAPYDSAIRDVLLEGIIASGSDVSLMPLQDVFGWRDRINEPATVTPENWTWRLPWPCDRLNAEPSATERKHILFEWARRHDRIGAEVDRVSADVQTT